MVIDVTTVEIGQVHQPQHFAQVADQLLAAPAGRGDMSLADVKVALDPMSQDGCQHVAQQFLGTRFGEEEIDHVPHFAGVVKILAHELLDAICEHDLEIVDWALQFDPDIIHFGDDWGQQRGLIMGPRIWQEFLKPCLARLYARVRKAGKLVSIHSCGDVDELFDQLIELGLNLFNPFQPEVMDVYALKKQYHGRLAFHGGMSIQRVLPFGTPKDVEEEVKRRVGDFAPGGGFVFTQVHNIQPDVPPENIMAMYDALDKYGKY